MIKIMASLSRKILLRYALHIFKFKICSVQCILMPATLLLLWLLKYAFSGKYSEASRRTILKCSSSFFKDAFYHIPLLISACKSCIMATLRKPSGWLSPMTASIFCRSRQHNSHNEPAGTIIQFQIWLG